MNKDKDAMSLGSSQPQSGSQSPRKPGMVETDEMDDLASLMGGVTVQTRNCDVCQIELSSAESKDGAVCCVYGKLASVKIGRKVAVVQVCDESPFLQVLFPLVQLFVHTL